MFQHGGAARFTCVNDSFSWNCRWRSWWQTTNCLTNRNASSSNSAQKTGPPWRPCVNCWNRLQRSLNNYMEGQSYVSISAIQPLIKGILGAIWALQTTTMISRQFKSVAAQQLQTRFQNLIYPVTTAAIPIGIKATSFGIRFHKLKSLCSGQPRRVRASIEAELLALGNQSAPESTGHSNLSLLQLQTMGVQALTACFAIWMKTTKLICQRYQILKNWHPVQWDGSWQCLRLNRRRPSTQTHSAGGRSMNTDSNRYHAWLSSTWPDQQHQPQVNEFFLWLGIPAAAGKRACLPKTWTLWCSWMPTAS